MTKNVIVVGMPRSGTSLATAIFARQGYFVGDSDIAAVRKGDDHNPFGYFEADDLIESNVQLFRQAGYEFHNTWLFDPISDEATARLADISPQQQHCQLVESYQQHSPWVWKDPRLCFTLPFWWRLMDPATTGVLLVRRDPTQIYRSFRRKGWCQEASDEQLERVRTRTQQHLAAATRAIDSLAIPHVVVDYAEYEQNADSVAQRLNDFFGVSLSACDLNYVPELNHASSRGRIAAWLRIQLMKLPRRPVRAIERLIPRWILASIFPERRYTEGKAK